MTTSNAVNLPVLPKPYKWGDAKGTVVVGLPPRCRKYRPMFEMAMRADDQRGWCWRPVDNRYDYLTDGGACEPSDIAAYLWSQSDEAHPEAASEPQDDQQAVSEPQDDQQAVSEPQEAPALTDRYKWSDDGLSVEHLPPRCRKYRGIYRINEAGGEWLITDYFGRACVWQKDGQLIDDCMIADSDAPNYTSEAAARSALAAFIRGDQQAVSEPQQAVSEPQQAVSEPTEAAPTYTDTKAFRRQCEAWGIEKEEADDYLKAARGDLARDKREQGFESGSDEALRAWGDALDDALGRLDPAAENFAMSQQYKNARDYNAKIEGIRTARAALAAHLLPLIEAGESDNAIDNAAWEFDSNEGIPGVAAKIKAGTYETDTFGKLYDLSQFPEHRPQPAAVETVNEPTEAVNEPQDDPQPAQGAETATESVTGRKTAYSEPDEGSASDADSHNEPPEPREGAQVAKATNTPPKGDRGSETAEIAPSGDAVPVGGEQDEQQADRITETLASLPRHYDGYWTHDSSSGAFLLHRADTGEVIGHITARTPPAGVRPSRRCGSLWRAAEQLLAVLPPPSPRGDTLSGGRGTARQPSGGRGQADRAGVSPNPPLTPIKNSIPHTSGKFSENWPAAGATGAKVRDPPR